MFEKQGFSLEYGNLEACANGKLALEAIPQWRQARKHDFRVIFTDLFMPECDGFEFTRLLREYYQSIQRPMDFPWVFALTASTNEEEHRAGKAVGMEDVLLKPLQASKLTDIVEKYGVLASLKDEQQQQQQQENSQSNSESNLTVSGSASASASANPSCSPSPNAGPSPMAVPFPSLA